MLLLADLAAHRGHPGGELPARPFTSGAKRTHIVCDALRRVLTLQLCESGKNIHDSTPHGRGGVEGLFNRHERDVMLLKDIVHGGKFLHVTADSIQFVDHDDIQHIVPHIRH